MPEPGQKTDFGPWIFGFVRNPKIAALDRFHRALTPATGLPLLVGLLAYLLPARLIQYVGISRQVFSGVLILATSCALNLWYGSQARYLRQRRRYARMKKDGDLSNEQFKSLNLAAYEQYAAAQHARKPAS